MRYWIVVVSKDHIERGIAGGFMQANHGKPGPLRRMAIDDWMICYSSKQTMKGTEPYQAFTAIGQVADEEIYQHKVSDGFMPFRRNIKYLKCEEIPIAPLIEQLEFITNEKSWGYQFRFGFFEIGEKDFKLIKDFMVD